MPNSADNDPRFLRTHEKFSDKIAWTEKRLNDKKDDYYVLEDDTCVTKFKFKRHIKHSFLHNLLQTYKCLTLDSKLTICPKSKCCIIMVCKRAWICKIDCYVLNNRRSSDNSKHMLRVVKNKLLIIKISTMLQDLVQCTIQKQW